jgi:chromate transporter
MSGGAEPTHRGSALEVLLAFTKMGVTSFGGPIAHLGYFRNEFVVRRRWLDEHTYGELVALAQFLPGPASSQVGFSLGILRAGLPGAVAAWVAFTLPSALLLLSFAALAGSLGGSMAVTIMHGLKLVSVSIVAQAVWSMARALCPDLQRVLIACVTGAAILLLSTPLTQTAAIVLGGIAGVLLVPTQAMPASQLPQLITRKAGTIALALFAALFIGLLVLRSYRPDGLVAMFEAFYRSGALVFGGGHVVLPLLHGSFVTNGWVSNDAFLAGYGAAQAVPGPLFTFAAYLGAVASPSPQPVMGAAIGIAGIFLPGLLMMSGALPFWGAMRSHPSARRAMAGANAAVVGLLAAALCTPVWTGAVFDVADAVLAVGGFVLLVFFRLPPLIVVVLTVVASVWRT